MLSAARGIKTWSWCPLCILLAAQETRKDAWERFFGVSGVLQLRSVGDDLKFMGEVQEISIGNTCHFLERSGDQRGGWEAVFGQSRCYPESEMLVTNLAEGLCMLCRNCGEG